MESAGDNARHQHRHEGGEYRRIELITGAPRRRRWSAAEKAAMVAESLQAGVNVSELARLRGGPVSEVVEIEGGVVSG
jgi:transposase